jgi:hypothetical protein
MHTSEPRILRNADNSEVYIWRLGTGLDSHMELIHVNDDRLQLSFDPLVFATDLDSGVFGPSGYFEDLRREQHLQDKYRKCFEEMENYCISFRKAAQ